MVSADIHKAWQGFVNAVVDWVVAAVRFGFGALNRLCFCLPVPFEGVRGFRFWLSPPVLCDTGGSGPAASEYGRLGARGEGQRFFNCCCKYPHTFNRKRWLFQLMNQCHQLDFFN